MHRSIKTILASALTATLLLAGAPTGQAAARGVNYYGLNRCAIRFIAIYRRPQLSLRPGCTITIVLPTPCNWLPLEFYQPQLANLLLHTQQCLYCYPVSL